MENLPRGIFLSSGGNLIRNDFDHLEPFSKLKTTFCKCWTLVEIKISMTCVYKEYEDKMKMVQGQWLQLKMKFLLGYTIKIIIY